MQGILQIGKEGASHHVDDFKGVTVNLRFILRIELSTMASRAQEPLCKRVNGVLFCCVKERRQIKRSYGRTTTKSCLDRFHVSIDNDSIRVNQAPAFDQFYHLPRLLCALSACLEFCVLSRRGRGALVC
jgi:hypothetical protein